MTARTFTLSTTFPLNGIHGIVIEHDRGRAISSREFLSDKELLAAFALAKEVLTTLHEAALRPGTWTRMTIKGPHIPYDTYAYAAWLVTNEHPDRDLRISIKTGGKDWFFFVQPECTEDHHHTTRILRDGKYICVDARETTRTVRDMERAGAFA